MPDEVLLVLYALLALVFSFLCSVAEAVLLSTRPAHVALLQQQGRRSGHLLAALKADVDRPLAAILTLNTVAHTVGAAGVGAQAALVFENVSLGVISAVLTFLILFVSEIVPKTLGATYWRSLSPAVAWALEGLVLALLPFVWVSTLVTQLLSGGRKESVLLRRQEIAALAEHEAEQGTLEKRESNVLRNLLHLRSTCMRDIMTPRTVVFSLNETSTVKDFAASHLDRPFSRIPVHRGDRDDMTGFVLRTDILTAHARGENGAPLSSFRRDMAAVPENVPLSRLFEVFAEKRTQIAVVVDEYGGTDGIVTLEDLMETLLGLEIVDELDTTTDMQARARALWEARARGMGIDPGPAAAKGTGCKAPKPSGDGPSV